MKVIKTMYFNDYNKLETKHKNERSKRLESYQELLSDKFIKCFLVDKEHDNGLEIHCINEHGLIYIYNHNTKKFITALHPRPSQIKRYYRLLNMEIPQRIKRLSRLCYKRNEVLKLNDL